MKKADVKIGGTYYAKVTNRKVEIRIDAEKPRGSGWDATNLATGKKIHIKSAQRLQGEVGAPRGRAKATTAENTAVVETESTSVETASANTSTAVAPVKKPRKAKVEAAEAGDKKLSCVAAALKVLGEADEPMNAQEMITAMETKGYWASPGGKTPHATLYSAILRDLAKGDDSRFVKTERGRFTVRG